MKICFISSYPPEKEGVGQFTKRLVDNFDDKKCDISILTFKYDTQYKNRQIYKVLGLNPKDLENTYQTLKLINPDIIHLQYATPVFRLLSPLLLAILWIFKKNYNPKVIFTFHEVSRETELLKIFGLVYYYVISSIADQIIVHTSEAKELLIRKCKINSRKINIIPLGLFSSTKDTKNAEIVFNVKNLGLPNKKIVLFFGYIHVDKGIEVLIKAVSQLFTKYPDMKSKVILVIAGDVRPRKGIFRLFELIDHIYKRKLLSLTKELSLENNVVFKGYIKDSEVIPLIKSSSVLVMPYKKVEQSGVLNIALNCNMPITASELGGLKELLGETGLTFESKDSICLEKKITQVLNNDVDTQKLSELYKVIRDNNSLDKVINGHLRLYESAI
jgi:glycosyltransferase involved in cell wall biosynthesis